MNLSFAGCGFLGIYHVGVAACFKKFAPHLLVKKISGASAGALAACSLLCDLSIGDLASDILCVATEARKNTLGPFNPKFNIGKILKDCLDRLLPEDAHVKCSGRLHISLTRVVDGRNEIMSQFDTRDELRDALVASCFIPIFSGIIPPTIRGCRYVDGGYSNNLPTLDENTVTVSPFCGESDICPRDDSMQLFHINFANTSIEVSKHNIYRFVRILFPPAPDVLSNMCKQGFDDALRFLHRNNLLNCTRCLSVQTTFVVNNDTSDDDTILYDPECVACKTHRQEALVANLPDTILAVFQEAIDSANKGLMNWFYKHRGVKILSLLAIPYQVPIDLMVATFTKVIEHLPRVGEKVWDVGAFLLNQVKILISKIKGDGRSIRPPTRIIRLTDNNENETPTNVEQHDNLLYAVEMDITPKSPPGKALSRRSSVVLNNNAETGSHDDAFESILKVAADHEAAMTYYYLDDHDRMKITEIFNVTESDSPVVQSQSEKETNQQLQFDDDDFESAVWMTGPDGCKTHLTESRIEGRIDGVELTEYDDIIEGDTTNLFSDPESEWLDEKVEEEESGYDLMPESDQAESENLRRPFQVPSFNFDHSS